MTDKELITKCSYLIETSKLENVFLGTFSILNRGTIGSYMFKKVKITSPIDILTNVASLDFKNCNDITILVKVELQQHALELH